LEKIRISAVSYLNTIPFIFGIEQSDELSKQIELSKDIPSICAKKLLNDEVDLGLVPVAIIPELNKAHIVSDYCIGAEGKVKSVLLVSDVPIEAIEHIYLDYQSRTSVRLCQVLCAEHWKVAPSFTPAPLDYEERIDGTHAGVIIGDRTFHLKKNYPYQYDLAEEWQKMTSLPFVFAAWVSNKELPNEFVRLFNQSLEFGLQKKTEAIKLLSDSSIDESFLYNYLSEFISFDLTSSKKKGLEAFLSKI
jgi:chorismate dehydratase